MTTLSRLDKKIVVDACVVPGYIRMIVYPHTQTFKKKTVLFFISSALAHAVQ
jgi:hypothetical protein